MSNEAFPTSVNTRAGHLACQPMTIERGASLHAGWVRGIARRLGSLALAVVLAAMSCAGLVMTSTSAHAEGRIRIAEQFGVVYLLLNIARDQQLIEKEGKKQGVDIQVEWTRLSGGAEINNALLSDAIDVGGAGVGPLLTIWDRTYGKQSVKGVASLGSFPYYLVSNNPKVHSIADLGAQDKIALPAVTVSVQSRVLQMAAAHQWGDAQYLKLDALTMSVPHPDATAAIISGGTEITGHFGNPPFSQQELAANPKAHIILNSYDVLGGPASATVLYATQKFHDANPKTYQAFVAALADAAQFATAHPDQAADIYLKVNQSKLDRALLLKILTSPEVHLSVTPQNTFPLAQFMTRVGAIRNAPRSWQDYFFVNDTIGRGS
jgi:NitT/TauT family transport system substrate-binding protein